MNAIQYCRDKVAPEGSDSYYCLLFTPAPHRDALLALFALERELQEVVEECSDPAIAYRKLEFWSAELARLDGRGASHPVARALQQSAAGQHLRPETRSPLLCSVRRRISAAQIADEAELQCLCLGTAGTLMALASRVLGDAARDHSSARTLGAAIERVRLLRLPQRAGAPPHTGVPLELIAGSNARPEDIDRASGAPAAVALRAALLAGARRSLESALTARPAPPGALRGLGRLAHAHLCALSRSGFEAHAVGRGITPIRKLWIAWRNRD